MRFSKYFFGINSEILCYYFALFQKNAGVHVWNCQNYNEIQTSNLIDSNSLKNKYFLTKILLYTQINILNKMWKFEIFSFKIIDVRSEKQNSIICL
jgi:hypothetical protein